MKQWIYLSIAALAAGQVAVGQTAAEKCRVEGTVLNAVTGQPVRKAKLSLMPAKGGEPVIGASDAQGRYALSNVAPGVYRLFVSRDGYQTKS